MARSWVSRLRDQAIIIAFLGVWTAGAAGDDGLEFFERDVRPLLVARCQGCHGPEKSKGDLRLDSRAAALAGGKSGPAVVPGQPDESLLIDAINYGDLYQMPPKSKLPDREIATLTRWVEMGAPWSPSDAARPVSASASTFNLRERAKHWCFQPIHDRALPDVQDKPWSRTLIDRFILSALEARGMAPAPEADRRTLIRRITFDLVGLPPTPDEVEAFVSDESPGAYEKVVEGLLGSPHYGERWARHWLDLVRYAETSGHEFDYDVLDAYRYRDYIIRALNADLPYDQLVVEHVAGDLLEPPRRHPTEGFNESVLGTGFFLLGEGTHSPVDLLEEEAARVDNQIDVFSKTFLGLTVACARCHDHKFDAISTRDYYALYGYLQSSRHQHAFIDPPSRIASQIAELREIKAALKTASDRSDPPPVPSGTAVRSVDRSSSSVVFEDFDGPTFEGWDASGDAFGSGPSGPGEFVVTARGLVPVAEGQAHSGLLSHRLQGVLRSRTFRIEKPFVQYLASGRKGRINLVTDGFEKIRSPIYGPLTLAIDEDKPRWYIQDVGMWVGHHAYIEIADGSAVDFTGSRSGYDEGDGFIAVDEIRFSDEKPSPIVPASLAAGRAVRSRFGSGESDDLLARYRKVESQIPLPTLALALVDGTSEDERVHIRGGTKTLGDIVPRRYLEVLAGPDQSPPGEGSGRLELAHRMIDPANPLLARVMVNRIWKHHFGEGIVKTTDDFGVMGEKPTHPELLDLLAARFIAEGWSIKQMHRMIVLSSTYRMQSRPIAEAERADPSNRLLHRMNVRRLEAEAIRDALIAVSGRLDPTLFGPSVAPYLSDFMDGRGRPPVSGPLDGNGRRSVYLNVRRNFLNPMFLAFDFPVPFATMGRRNVSNVPAQALSMLNDPFVVGQARNLARRVLSESNATPRERLDRLYLLAFGRPPTDREAAEALAFLKAQANPYMKPDDPLAWADLCHVLFNVKEFIYVN